MIKMEKKFEVIKGKKDLFIYVFYWFGRTSVLCLRTREGSKPRSSGLKLMFDLFLCFLLVLKMILKWKSQVANDNWFVFFEENCFEVELKWLMFDLRK